MALFLMGIELPTINSLRDRVLTAFWLRREQFRIFETMITVLAAGLPLDPKVSEKIEGLMNDYMDLVIPGTKKKQKQEDETFANRTAQALNDVANLLANSNNSKINKNMLL